MKAIEDKAVSAGWFLVNFSGRLKQEGFAV
jgi:hypothetical protein